MINNELCKTLGIEFPLFAFTHCRDVVVAVSKAGGFGVFGAVGYTPDELETELRWIDEHIDGKPYGLDVLVPENLVIKDEVDKSMQAMAGRIPPQHREFVQQLLERHGVKGGNDLQMDRPTLFTAELAEAQMDVAFRHPIRLIANALGIPPASMIERAKKHGIPVAALVGAKEHAVRQVQAGVDIIVAQGAEAGGHCGEVSTLVLVPEVIRAVNKIKPVPVLAAGGIMTGAQMAACMAMGAAGAWTGSVWLPTTESEVTQTIRDKLVAAGSRDTVRSTSRTGKPARQLRSAWTQAWDDQASPGSLPMPFQPMLSRPALKAVDKSAEAGNAQARELVTYFVGQGIGLVDSVKSSRTVVQEFMEDFAEAVERMQGLVEAD
jgi:NAD(P)H-dependent flavin oxidoreductase YrpB (nitropropane dioxygenase family)